MPLTVNKLALRRVTLPIAVGDDESFIVKYLPARLADRNEEQEQAIVAKISGATNADELKQALITELLGFLNSTDLTEEDGSPLPLTPERLAQPDITLDALLLIYRSVQADYSTGNAYGTSSSPASVATSSPAAPTTTSSADSSPNPPSSFS